MKKWSECLSEPERWQWHAEVYAFRRVYLGTSIEDRVSPCDPDGRWFDAFLVRAAETRMRETIARVERERREADRNARAEQQRRFALAAEWRRSEAGKAALAGNFRQIGAALGVTAREYKPTAEQLRAGRAALGLDVGMAGPG